MADTGNVCAQQRRDVPFMRMQCDWIRYPSSRTLNGVRNGNHGKQHLATVPVTHDAFGKLRKATQALDSLDGPVHESHFATRRQLYSLRCCSVPVSAALYESWLHGKMLVVRRVMGTEAEPWPQADQRCVFQWGLTSRLTARMPPESSFRQGAPRASMSLLSGGRSLPHASEPIIHDPGLQPGRSTGARQGRRRGFECDWTGVSAAMITATVLAISGPLFLVNDFSLFAKTKPLNDRPPRDQRHEHIDRHALNLLPLLTIPISAPAAACDAHAQANHGRSRRGAAEALAPRHAKTFSGEQLRNLMMLEKSELARRRATWMHACAYRHHAPGTPPSIHAMPGATHSHAVRSNGTNQ